MKLNDGFKIKRSFPTEMEINGTVIAVGRCGDLKYEHIGKAIR